MIQSNLRKFFLILAVILIPGIIEAAVVPSWKILPQNSSITFTATQNNAPVSGTFKSFTGEIKFDPTLLDKSNVHIVINVNSLSTSDPEIADNLKTADWFDVKHFPQAIFNVNKFIKTGNNTYQAQGMLTIRDKTLPTTVSFVLKEYSLSKTTVNGKASLKRTAFGIGQGEWASSDVVKDDVQVNFQINATKK
jgi:polyisoprenoid-binding protein YceI